MSLRTILAWAAAGLATLVAVGLVVLAVDVFRVAGELSERDARFEAAPARQARLWTGMDFLRGWPAVRLLGVNDDLDYRRTAGLYLRAEPGKVDYQGFPHLEALRAKAQFEVTRASREDPDAERRAQLLVLYGVMTLDARPLSDEERQNQIRGAADAFRAALALDPDNIDAKLNLEMVLSIHGPVALPGNTQSGGQDQGTISGAGRTGGGY